MNTKKTEVMDSLLHYHAIDCNIVNTIYDFLNMLFYRKFFNKNFQTFLLVDSISVVSL